MIVVTTPTGQIGSQVVQDLLAAGEQVRVIAREPKKLHADVRERVDVVTGSIEDESVMMRALEGAQGLFHVVPPNMATRDVHAYYLDMARVAAKAAVAQGVGHVVSVSAIGRGANVKAGAVSAALAKDEEFEHTGLNYRALWCPGFMDNMLWQVQALKQQGAFFFPNRGNVKAPYAATRDIAAVGAKLLRDRTWTGHGGVGVLGPEDLTLDEMAAILTDVLGKPIRYQQVPAEAYKAQLIDHGASVEMARDLVEMFEAKDNGLDRTVKRTPENSTPTSFRQWSEEVLKPAFLSA